MRRTEIIESALILGALASLWIFVVAKPSVWQTLVGLLVLGLMAWIAVRRIRRIRAAAAEAKRKREEAERSGRPPWLTS